MVAGDTREPPPDPKGGGGGAADAEVVPERSNGFAASWVTPVDCEDDDFDEVSDFRASSADDAAPRASSMTGLRQTPRSAAFSFPHRLISKRRAIPKNPIKYGFLH